jgi:hypothetical protein
MRLSQAAKENVHRRALAVLMRRLLKNVVRWPLKGVCLAGSRRRNLPPLLSVRRLESPASVCVSAAIPLNGFRMQAKDEAPRQKARPLSPDMWVKKVFNAPILPAEPPNPTIACILIFLSPLFCTK